MTLITSVDYSTGGAGSERDRRADLTLPLNSPPSLYPHVPTTAPLYPTPTPNTPLRPLPPLQDLFPKPPPIPPPPEDYYASTNVCNVSNDRQMYFEKVTFRNTKICIIKLLFYKCRHKLFTSTFSLG